MSEAANETTPEDPRAHLAPVDWTITDVSDRMPDLNPGEDRVYLVEPGRWYVKVKTFLEPIHDDVSGRTHHQGAKLSFSGSICDATGKALRRPETGQPIVWDHGQTHHVGVHGTDDTIAMIEQLGRRECARITVNSERVYAHLYGYQENSPGIPTREQFAARKAAEAAAAEQA